MTAPDPSNPALKRILDADLRFFKRWPRRNYRLRLAGLPELSEISAKFGGIAIPTRPDVRAFCALRRVGTAAFTRVAGFAIDCGEPTDFPDEIAHEAYDVLGPASLTDPLDLAALWRAAPNLWDQQEAE